MTDTERFLSLFNQQVQHSLNILASIPNALWTAIPVDSDTNFLGQRVNRITITALTKHLCTTEQYWAGALASIEDQGVMPPPSGSGAIGEFVSAQDILRAYQAQHAATLAILAGLTEARLNKRFSFVGRHYTVSGFLWAIYGHHCYHFGQIDQLLRQQNFMPPEFLELPETTQVIA